MIKAAQGIHVSSVPAHPTNYAPTRGGAPVLWVVLHCTEGGELVGSALKTATMFAAKLDKPRSAHDVCDAEGVIACVPWDKRAWHCGGTGNKHGVGVELCGKAAQTRAQWLDARSLPMLANGARRVREICTRFALPIEFRTAVELRAKHPGITTHDEIRRAFGETSHTDPGQGFPLADFLEAVRVG